MTDCRSHAAHLAIAPFGECDFEPCCGNGLAHADGWIAGRKIGLAVEKMHLGGACFVVADVDALAEPL